MRLVWLYRERERHWLIVEDVASYEPQSWTRRLYCPSQYQGTGFQDRAQKSAHPAALDAIIVVNIVGDGGADKYYFCSYSPELVFI
jgi:hypothetical protein